MLLYLKKMIFWILQTKSWNDHLNINLLAPAILTKNFANKLQKKQYQI